MCCSFKPFQIDRDSTVNKTVPFPEASNLKQPTKIVVNVNLQLSNYSLHTWSTCAFNHYFTKWHNRYLKDSMSILSKLGDQGIVCYTFLTGQ